MALSILNVCGLIFCIMSAFEIINTVIPTARIAYRREPPPAIFYNTPISKLYVYQGYITVFNLALLGLTVFLPFDETVKLMLCVIIPVRVLARWQFFFVALKNR